MSDFNLLSVREFTKDGGWFVGNSSRLIVFDKWDKQIVCGTDNGSGFRMVPKQQLMPADGNVRCLLKDEELSDGEDEPGVEQKIVTERVSDRHMSAEERVRARDAYMLCRLIGHPGDHAVQRRICVDTPHVPGPA
jgi:hypothetical protein